MIKFNYEASFAFVTLLAMCALAQPVSSLRFRDPADTSKVTSEIGYSGSATNGKVYIKANNKEVLSIQNDTIHGTFKGDGSGLTNTLFGACSTFANSSASGSKEMCFININVPRDGFIMITIVCKIMYSSDCKLHALIDHTTKIPVGNIERGLNTCLQYDSDGSGCINHGSSGSYITTQRITKGKHTIGLYVEQPSSSRFDLISPTIGVMFFDSKM